MIVAEDAKSIYQVPLNFLKEDILTPIARNFSLPPFKPDMQKWGTLVQKIISPTQSVTIGFVGKYLSLKESYKSLTEALIHAGANLDTKVNIKWIDSERLDANSIEELQGIDGILIPGGFGERGVEGKIKAIQYARENKIPFLGICLGMQLCIIEFARNVLGITDATSSEFDPKTQSPLIYMIEDFIDQEGYKQIRTHTSPLGGTMRLGEYNCDLKHNSKLQKAYRGIQTAQERHRHRYEANPKYRSMLEEAGMIVSGESDGLIEAVELRDHPWFIAVQFHPEFTSRLQNPNPIILEFVYQALKH